MSVFRRIMKFRPAARTTGKTEWFLQYWCMRNIIPHPVVVNLHIHKYTYMCMYVHV